MSGSNAWVPFSIKYLYRSLSKLDSNNSSLWDWAPSLSLRPSTSAVSVFFSYLLSIPLADICKYQTECLLSDNYIPYTCLRIRDAGSGRFHAISFKSNYFLARILFIILDVLTLI